jgi:hypothetical protein
VFKANNDRQFVSAIEDPTGSLVEERHWRLRTLADNVLHTFEMREPEPGSRERDKKYPGVDLISVSCVVGKWRC